MGPAAVEPAALPVMPGYGTARERCDHASLADHVHGSGWVTDAHLALIAGAHGGALATFDSRAAVLAQDLGAQSVLLPV